MSFTRASLIADCHRRQREFAADVELHELLANCKEQMTLDAQTIETQSSVLKGYERWEADVIMDDNCWRDSPMVLTQPQYDRLIELQQLRNAALTTTGD